jgi:hypothetical protein
LAFLACLPVFVGARTRAGAIAERAPSDSMVERTRVVRVGVYGCRLVEKPSEITSDDEAPTIDTRPQSGVAVGVAFVHLLNMYTKYFVYISNKSATNIRLISCAMRASEPNRRRRADD